ncbi:hypothetical protein O181_102105 [Austropuccinia psidii MF-1]|uniref:Uncharacterized protein n=1 Tax=Austropuccinia psidii MF-1 TaxID=1389203 RepID=A0A9Q3JIY2_9BASI|nr:hypothetical protein [Austropuccinia psidii MF-1]
MFSPFHKDDTAIDTAIMILTYLLATKAYYRNIISDRDPKFASALWINPHNMFRTKLSLSTAYHHQEDGLEERMRKNLEEMILQFCAYGLEFKESYFLLMICVLEYQPLTWHIRNQSINQLVKHLQCQKKVGAQYYLMKPLK